MTIIQLQHVEHSLGAEALFSEVSISFAEHTRVALVGQNGSGKSTLLKIVGRELEPDRGVVSYRRDAIVEYVPQLIPDRLKSVSLKDSLVRHAHDRGVVVEDWKIEVMLREVRFSDEAFDQPLGTFSGGEVNRAMLARALILDPHFLLLDEPTNHLDSEGIIQFESLISTIKVPFCIVSHDRELLDRVTDETLFLRDRRLYHIRAPFSQARLELEKLDLAAAENRAFEEKEIERLEQSASRLQQWAKRSDKMAPRYRAMLTRVDRAKSDLTFVTQERKRALSVAAQEIRADHVMSVKGVRVGFETKPLFNVEALYVSPGDRIAILGKNGAGKSTFLKTIVAGFRDEREGVSYNPQVRLGYFDQELAELDPNAPILDYVVSRAEASPASVTGPLIAAGFGYHRHKSKISSLSGGEKARLQFLSLKLSKPTFLVLDEPTNHIDVQGAEMMEQDLINSAGTLVFVSHDRRFVSTVATRFLLIHQGMLQEIESAEPYYQLLASTERS